MNQFIFFYQQSSPLEKLFLKMLKKLISKMLLESFELLVVNKFISEVSCNKLVSDRYSKEV